MGGSLERVRAALIDAGIAATIIEMPGSTRTAAEAAAAAGCALDQIAKSVIFRGQDTDQPLLFLTAGGNRVDPDKAARFAGEGLARADAAFVRDRTGFAIGGVSPVGHPGAVRAFFDPRLAEFAVIWAAAGTPRHMFAIAPDRLRAITGAVAGGFVA